MELSLLFSIFLVTFQPIFELSIAIDMNAIANSNVKLGAQFIVIDRNVIDNSNVKVAIALFLQCIQSARVNSAFELGIALHKVHDNTLAFTVFETVITIRIRIITNSIFQFDVALYANIYTRI